MLTDEEAQLLEQWKTSVERFAVSDIQKCLTDDIIEVGLIILTLSAIESISGYFCGQRANKTTFARFLRSAYFPKEYAPLAEDLYPLRNGLFHDYASDANKFVLFRTREQGIEHLKTFEYDHGQAVALNRELFANDFLSAWASLITDIPRDREITQKVLRRIRDTDRSFLVVREISIKPTSPTWQTLGVAPTNQMSQTPPYTTYTGGTVSFNNTKKSDDSSQ